MAMYDILVISGNLGNDQVGTEYYSKAKCATDNGDVHGPQIARQ